MELSESRFLFLDCQTTGLSPQRSEIVEIGWSFSFEPAEIHTRLLRPEKIDRIPRKVWEMTGLSLAEVEKGESAADIWAKVIAETKEIIPVATVIHYAQFETPFLSTLNGGVLPWPVVCTYKVAQKLFHDLPAKTIRALSGHLGFELPEVMRSVSHVAATQKIWKSLLQALEEREQITTWEPFLEWYARPKEKKPKGPRKYLVDRDKRLDLPEGPGVYQMYSRRDKLLYVGKATSLRSRVNSYFTQRRPKRSRLNELVTQVADLKVIETDSPLEAALLENDLIKRYRPPYNYSLKNTSRKLYFASRNLCDVTAEYSDRCSWGPINSREPFESLELLQAILSGEVDHLDPARLKYPAEDLKSRAEKILTELGHSQLEKLSLFQLHQAGKKILHLPEPEDEIEASVHRKLKRSSWQIHDANWLCWFTECRVSWQKENCWRVLTFTGGELIERFEQETMPIGFKRSRAPLSQRRGSMSNLKHDRVKILLTDLTGMIKRGTRVRVEFSPTRVFDSAEKSRFSQILRKSREVGE